MSVYEGSLMVEMNGKEKLQYLKLQGTQLVFFEGKNLRKLGMFNLPDTSAKLQESGAVIIVKSPNTTCYLRSNPQGPKSELTSLFRQLTEAKLPSQIQTPVNVQSLPEKINLQVTQVHALLSGTEELVQLLRVKLDNHSILIDYAQKLTNYLSELKVHINSLIKFAQEHSNRRGSGINSQFESDRDSKKSVDNASFYSVESAGFDDIVHIEDGGRKVLPRVEQLPQQLDFNEILKDFKNKELADIRLPSKPVLYSVIAYEPLSILQRLCQQFERADLLNKADLERQPGLKMCYVVAFILSPYRSQKQRLRMPFQQILNQTFSYYEPKSETNIRAESLSDKPYHVQITAESKGFHLTQETKLVGKYYGNNLEVRTIGTTFIRFKGTNQVVEYERPYIIIRNILTNQPFLDLSGEPSIFNQKTNMKTVIHFSSQSGFSANISQENVLKYTMGDRWDQTIMVLANGSRRKMEILKSGIEKAPDVRYGMTEFALQLNYIPMSGGTSLDLNDSRNRKDIRYLQEGKIKNAEKQREKLIVARQQARNQRKNLKGTNSSLRNSSQRIFKQRAQ